MTKHTPGPYKVFIQSTTQLRVIAAYNKSICIADMPQWADENWQERYANAQLLAAAPVMFQALKELSVDGCLCPAHQRGTHTRTCRAASEAIKRLTQQPKGDEDENQIE